MTSQRDFAPTLDTEHPTPRQCLERAIATQDDDPARMLSWLRRVVDDDGDFAAWNGAAALLDRHATRARAAARRVVKLGLVGSYTTNQLTGLLRLAAHRYGVWLETYEAGFDQYRQEVLDPGSGLHRFRPDMVLIATHEGAVDLPDHAGDPDTAVRNEAERWAALWRRIEDTGAGVIHHNFVVPPDDVYGNLAPALPGARSSMVRTLNLTLGDHAGSGVSIVDCDALASRMGKDRWLDERYWFMAKQAVALGALPALARHTAAVLAARVGLARKVLVLDLDHTLWGGVVGDDGLEGIRLGQGSAEGEAYLAFQRYCKALADRGVVLAVCSKNDEVTAHLPFHRHPEMVLTEDDIAVFVANWAPKPDNLRRIAETLDLGLDALVLADDNPAEREIVRRMVPAVEVAPLPADPAGYPAAVAGTLLFESAAVTAEDRQRTRQYKARAVAAEMKQSAATMEDFYRDLGMEAEVAPFDELNLPRVVQLVGKTNQFNLTTRRHGEETIRRMMADPDIVTFHVKIRDRLADHGLIAVVIGRLDGDALEIDTWAMSCRVIGRTVERTVLAHLVEKARNRRLATLRGLYRPTGRNGLVSGLFAELGFTHRGTEGETEVWTMAVPDQPVRNEFIREPLWV